MDLCKFHYPEREDIRHPASHEYQAQTNFTAHRLADAKEKFERERLKREKKKTRSP